MTAQPADPDTIRAQLETLHPESFAWALVCCAHDPIDAEDVLQMTYLKILDDRARYAGRSAFKTWLFGVIRFTAREQRRWAWLRWLRRAPIEDAELQHTSDASPDEAAARSEIVAQVQAACERLPARQREVIMLVFHHELALDEAMAGNGRIPGLRAQTLPARQGASSLASRPALIAKKMNPPNDPQDDDLRGALHELGRKRANVARNRFRTRGARRRPGKGEVAPRWGPAWMAVAAAATVVLLAVAVWPPKPAPGTRAPVAMEIARDETLPTDFLLVTNSDDPVERLAGEINALLQP